MIYCLSRGEWCCSTLIEKPLWPSQLLDFYGPIRWFKRKLKSVFRLFLFQTPRASRDRTRMWEFEASRPARVTERRAFERYSTRNSCTRWGELKAWHCQLAPTCMPHRTPSMTKWNFFGHFSEPTEEIFHSINQKVTNFWINYRCHRR